MIPSHIMIAEDENIVAMDIREALTAARYTVSGVVGSGHEALAMAADTRPDLILMDIRLKGEVDGVQAALQIRERYDIPIVYLTAYSDESTVERAKATEPYGYLIKPFEKDELHTTIEMALHKHRSERELKENRRWLSAILQSTGDAVVATDARGLVTFMNPVAEALTGWTAEALAGRPWSDGVRLHEADDGEASLRREFLEGTPGRLSPHTALTARDGARRPVDGSLAPTKDEKGRVTGFVLAFRDVAERKRLEDELRAANQDLERRVRERTEALRESESRFRSLAETAPDGVLLTDADGRVVFCNRSTQTLFGYTGKELTAQGILRLMPERSHPIFKEALRGLGGEGAIHRTVELHGRDKAGREFPVEMSLSTWVSGGGRFYAGILRDLSERQQAESHLRFQAGILAQVKDAVIALDEDDRVIYWNRGAERLYGLKTVEAIGLGLEEVPAGGASLPGLARWVPEAAAEEVDRALARADVWHGEAVHRDKAGGEVAVEMSVGSLRNEEDASVGRLLVIRDVSQRRRLESLLLHSERLAAMGQMAAGIAHELKTPLGVISGYVDLLRRKREKGEDDFSVLDTLQRQVSRCVAMADNLLGFSRKGDGKSGEEDVDVNEAAAAALALVEPHARAKSVLVRREFSPGAPPVRGVKEMLEQVVVNLAMNAVDAMEAGGVLTVATREAGEPPRAVLEVSDTGPGVPAADRERIFEPFFTTKGRGTGLGLWLVKRIAANFHGEISCASEEGKGSTFSASFPAAPRGESPR